MNLENMSFIFVGLLCVAWTFFDSWRVVKYAREGRADELF